MRRYFEFIHDLRIFLIAFQVYSVSMFPSIVFISIDLCMDYVNRLYCNKWEKRENEIVLGDWPLFLKGGYRDFFFSDALASLALMIVFLTHSLTDRNWRLAILHV